MCCGISCGKRASSAVLFTLLLLVLTASCSSGTPKNPDTYFGDIRDYMDPGYAYSPDELRILQKYGLTRELLEHPESWSAEEVTMMETAFIEELEKFDMDEFMKAAQEAAATSKSLRPEDTFYFYKGPAQFTIESEIISVTAIEDDPMEGSSDRLTVSVEEGGTD